MNIMRLFINFGNNYFDDISRRLIKKEIEQNKLDTMTNEIISFLNGNSDIIKDKLTKQMEKASLDMNYERALEIRDMLNDIDITLKKQQMSLNAKYNFDVFNFYRHNNYLSIEVFYIREGLMFGRHDTILNVVEDSDEALTEYIIKFYEKNNILPKEIIVPNIIDKDLLSEFLNIKVSSPTKGDIKNGKSKDTQGISQEIFCYRFW